MSAYLEKWAGSTVGSFPTGWTRRWHTTTNSPTIEALSSGTLGAAYPRQFEINSTAADREAFSFDAIDSDTDRDTIKIAALVLSFEEPSSGSPSYGGPWARGSGTNLTETGIAGVLGGISARNALKVLDYDNAGLDVYADVNGSDSWNDLVWYWHVLEISGDTATVTVYDFGSTPGEGGTAVTTFTQSGLRPSGDGWCGLFSFDANTNYRVAAIEFATGTSKLSYDLTPVLSSATGTSGGSGVANGSVSTDAAVGVLDAVLLPFGATTPSAAQIKAGTDGDDNAATGTDLDNDVSALGGQSVSFSGIAAGTYKIAYVQSTEVGADSNVIETSSFSVTSSTVLSVQVTLHDDIAPQVSLTGIHWVFWDAGTPNGSPDASGTGETTNASGVIDIDVTADTAQTGGDDVYILLFKEGATGDKDNLIFSDRVQLVAS